MSRDFKKLEVFHRADQLVIDVYRATVSFPTEERYGLQAQLRRASVSVPSNIVEGCARESKKEYAHFLRVACGSASEARYLFSVARRLQYLESTVAAGYEDRFDHIVRALEALAQRVTASAHQKGNYPIPKSTIDGRP
jgi:four helix bundle protein